MEGYGHVLDTPRLRLALLRDDLERAEQIVRRPAAGPRLAPRLAPALDPLRPARRARRGSGTGTSSRRGTRRARAPTSSRSTSARSAVVREDEQLLERSLAAFEALRLARHAAETRAVLA